MRLSPQRAAAAATVAALALALPAAASARVKPFAFSYRVVSASHSSSVSEVRDGYNGASSETWKLRAKTKDVADGGDFSYGGGVAQGLFQWNVSGTYRDSVTTNFDSDDPSEPNHCEVAVSTGDTSDNASVAPEQAQVNLVYDKRHKQVEGHWVFPMADLNPPIFPTSCSNPDTQLPVEANFVARYPLSLFRRKRFTLTDAGSPGGEYGTYQWTTKITLTRHGRPQ